jgi:hypothetical protein
MGEPDRWRDEGRERALTTTGADRLAIYDATGAQFAHNDFVPGIKSAAVVRLRLPQLRLDMIADPATARDEPISEPPAIGIVALEPCREIAVGRSERRSEALRIKRGLGDAGADMRPCHERGVAHESNTAEHDLR